MISTLLSLAEQGYSVEIKADVSTAAMHVSITKDDICVKRGITFVELKHLKGYSYEWVMCRILTQLMGEITTYLVEKEKES